MLCCVVLSVLYCIVVHCIVLYCIALSCIVLYCIAFYRFVLYCTVFNTINTFLYPNQSVSILVEMNVNPAESLSWPVNDRIMLTPCYMTTIMCSEDYRF